MATHQTRNYLDDVLPQELKEKIQELVDTENSLEKYHGLINQIKSSSILVIGIKDNDGVERSFVNLPRNAIGVCGNPHVTNLVVPTRHVFTSSWEFISGWKGVNLNIPIYSTYYYLNIKLPEDIIVELSAASFGWCNSNSIRSAYENQYDDDDRYLKLTCHKDEYRYVCLSQENNLLTEEITPRPFVISFKLSCLYRQLPFTPDTPRYSSFKVLKITGGQMKCPCLL